MLVTANLYYSDVTAMPQKLMFQGTIQVNTNVAYYLEAIGTKIQGSRLIEL